MSIVISFTEKALERKAKIVQREQDIVDEMLGGLTLLSANIKGLNDYFLRLLRAGVTRPRDIMLFEREHFFRLFPPTDDTQKRLFLNYMECGELNFLGEPKISRPVPKLFDDEMPGPDSQLD